MLDNIYNVNVLLWQSNMVIIMFLNPLKSVLIHRIALILHSNIIESLVHVLKFDLFFYHIQRNLKKSRFILKFLRIKNFLWSELRYSVVCEI